MFYTYGHYKPDGTIFYVGKGSISRAHSDKGRNKHWKNIVNKYKNFSVQIFGRWKTEKEAFDHEIFLIDCFKSLGLTLANISSGGLGSTGFRHSEEFKSRQRTRNLKNNPMSDPLIREKQLTNLKKAMKRPEIRSKISESKTGVKFSESHKKNLSLSHLGLCARGKSSSARKLEFDGKTFDCIKDYADYVGINSKTAYSRIARNPLKWGIEIK
jgi:hypothetical protein